MASNVDAPATAVGSGASDSRATSVPVGVSAINATGSGVSGSNVGAHATAEGSDASDSHTHMRAIASGVASAEAPGAMNHS